MTDLNPLTGLPGNSSIQRNLRNLVIDGESIAAYVDIIDFKPFNDYYGFALGDSVIRRLGQILEESIRGFFVGHIGGDDFICIGNGNRFTSGIENARQKFRSIAPGFYTARDRELGGIETFDREGSYRFLPLLDVAVVFTNSDDENVTVETLARKAGHTKKQLKGEQIAESVFPVLKTALQNGYPAENTKALIEACGVLREEKAVPVLAEILGGRYNWNLRKSAALALGHIGNARCTELLKAALLDSNPHVRTRSVDGLVISMGRNSGPLIAPLLRDESTWVRRAVLRGIGYAGWYPGMHFLKEAATGSAPGRAINTSRERSAALEGLAMLVPTGEADFLADLCCNPAYFPGEEAYRALCSVGTDAAADVVIGRKRSIPRILNLSGMSNSNLRRREDIAKKALAGDVEEIAGALRFLEGFPLMFDDLTVAELRNCLGSFSGDIFRRLVILLDSKGIAADRSCIARIANRIDSGQQIGTSALCAFLGWIARRGGVSPGSLLKGFLRGDRRAVAASAALTVRAIANRDLTQIINGETIS